MAENTQNNFQKTPNILDYLPNFPNTMPQEEFDYQPPTPFRRMRIPNLTPQNLSRRIYLDMQRATKDYGYLETLAPQQNKQTINSLRGQMQILTLTMLRIYNHLNGRRNIPFFYANNSPLPNNYSRALREMYSRVFHIHELTLRLYNKVDSQTAQTVLLVLLNLKSQLRELNKLLSQQ